MKIKINASEKLHPPPMVARVGVASDGGSHFKITTAWMRNTILWRREYRSYKTFWDFVAATSLAKYAIGKNKHMKLIREYLSPENLIVLDKGNNYILWGTFFWNTGWVLKVFDEPSGESNAERRVKISASVSKEGT